MVTGASARKSNAAIFASAVSSCFWPARLQGDHEGQSRFRVAGLLQDGVEIDVATGEHAPPRAAMIPGWSRTTKRR